MVEPTADEPTADKTSTADKIRDAAAELFTARSYADVTVDQVADAADVTKGAVYHHFESKEGLYLDTLLRDLERARLRHEAAASEPGTSRERLRALTASFLTLTPRERALVRLVRRDANVFAEPTRGRLVAAYQAAVPDPIARILRDAVRAGEVIPADPRILAWSFVALVEVLLTDYADERFASNDEKLDYLMSVFFRGCEWTARGADA